MKVLQVFEQQTLRVGEGGLSAAALDALALFNERHESKYFTLLRSGIRFRNYVGVLQVGQLTIEILPKLRLHQSTQKTWKNWLLELLQFCQYIHLETSTITALSLQKGTLLDLYIEFFISELEKILQRGRLQQYSNIEKNQNCYKGRLNFAKQFQKNLIRKDRFYTHYNIYDYNHTIHYLLGTAVQIAERINTNYGHQRRLKKLQAHFRPPPSKRKQNVLSYNSNNLQQQLGRTYLYYKIAIEVAQMLIHHYTPDLRGGSHEVLGIFFDMNRLFEEYVYKQCLCLQESKLTVQKQVTKLFWEHKTLRPDLVLNYKQKSYVLDMKWKLLAYPSPNDADLKQMYAYGQLFDSQRNILIYPQTGTLENKRASFQPDGDISCELFFANILDTEQHLNLKLGRDLIDWIKYSVDA